ncbi:MAG: NADP-dependent phosphogluconate dehydrogenase [Arenibacterium sp.]
MQNIGVFGLGTMGSALALNLAENAIHVVVGNRETEWIAPFLKEAGPLAKHLTGVESLEDLVTELAPPRAILFMIPSGSPMDAMLDRVVPLLQVGDTVIDAGNADFNATRARAVRLQKLGLNFVGMGVSGGEEGARNGPSMMVGGTSEGWARIEPMVTAIAARFQDDPCVAHVGPDGAGHFVKTVHNGIEYADMQMISEVYGLLRDGGGWPPKQIGALFEHWNDGPLQSFLIEASAAVLQATDPESGMPVVDVIRDSAGQKGTGRWTVIEALKLGQSANTIEAAVGARGWSSERDARVAASAELGGNALRVDLPTESELEQALLVARIIAHVQGFRVLRAASEEYNWALDLARIAEIWRAGCIIRSVLLDDLATALRDGNSEDQLILTPGLMDHLRGSVPALRKTVVAALQAGLPVPALSSALSWFDTMRQARGTANLIQAQRDFFGAHGFERTDRDGKFHGPWHRDE